MTAGARDLHPRHVTNCLQQPHHYQLWDRAERRVVKGPDLPYKALDQVLDPLMKHHARDDCKQEGHENAASPEGGEAYKEIEEEPQEPPLLRQTTTEV